MMTKDGIRTNAPIQQQHVDVGGSNPVVRSERTTPVDRSPIDGIEERPQFDDSTSSSSTKHAPLDKGAAIFAGSQSTARPGANVLGPDAIANAGRRGLEMVGGKNYNMAILNAIPGVRGADFRAVTAAGYDRHLDESKIDPVAMDRFLRNMFANTDFKALGESHGNAFQAEFVIEQADQFLTDAKTSSRGAVDVRSYVSGLIEAAKADLANPELALEDRMATLRCLSISAQVAILAAPLPASLEADIRSAYADLEQSVGKQDLDVAVRSSAVGEDSDDAAFAGAQDTYLNISGANDVVRHVQRNFASGFNVRALEYRLSQIDLEVDTRGTSRAEALDKFDFDNIAVSVTIQQMIKSEKAGTAFSVDPASGLDGVVSIDANFGYGESVVGGRVTPDNYIITHNDKLIVKTMGDKNLSVVDQEGGGTKEIEVEDRGQRFGWSLSDAEVKSVAAMVRAVQAKYGKHVDTEFAIDDTGVYLVQARPETKHNEEAEKSPGMIPMRRFEASDKDVKGAQTLIKGDGASKGATTGRVRFVDNIHDGEVLKTFEEGDILAAERTDPDFLPLFKRASAILADVGGRTSHAAITSRELNIPAVIGIGDIAGLRAMDGKIVTVDGSRGAVYAGELPLENKGEDIDTRALAKVETKTSVGLILADLDQAKALSKLADIPDFKVGLLRAEFVLGAIGVHYKALKAFDHGLFDVAAKIIDKGADAIDDTIRGAGPDEKSTLLAGLLEGTRSSPDPKKVLSDMHADLSLRLEQSGFESGHEFYVEMLSQKIALFAYAFEGKDVIYRTTDYKSNEYEGLLGGTVFEEPESNPMLGYRGVSRGIDGWELEAFKKARDEYGAENLHVMFPFVRTEDEIVSTVAAAKARGVKSGDKGLKVFVMAEIPSVATLPKTFLRHVDGFSIGSNDLTQGMLMTDRDSARLQRTYDEEEPAVVQGMLSIIFSAVAENKEAGFCGQGVSNSEFLAAMVSVAGITSASVTPDVYVKVKHLIHDIESRKIGVAELGDWMNDYKREGMQTALVGLAKSGVVEKFDPDIAPDQAYDLIANAMVRGNELVQSDAPKDVAAGRTLLAELHKVSKTVIGANTEWNDVVNNALFTAGFDGGAAYDAALEVYRDAHPHH